MITACFKALVVCLLLASFLTVQADLPVSRAAAERAAVTGEKCAPHECCCSTDAQQKGECCCASDKTPAGGFVWRASSCANDQSPGDAPIMVKFQVVLPLLPGLLTRDAEVPAVIVPQESPALHDAEPPDPPPKLLVG